MRIEHPTLSARLGSLPNLSQIPQDFWCESGHRVDVADSQLRRQLFEGNSFGFPAENIIASTRRPLVLFLLQQSPSLRIGVYIVCFGLLRSLSKHSGAWNEGARFLGFFSCIQYPPDIFLG
jgi:hypothetical protein